MFKNTFQRLLVTYMVIIVAVIGTLAMAMSQYMNYYFFEQKKRELQSAGKSVEALARKYGEDEISQGELVQAVNTAGEVAGARVVLLQGENLNEINTPDRDGMNGDTRDGLAEDVKEVLKGQTLVRKKYYSSYMNMYVVFVGVPVMIDGQVEGAVLLFSPLDRINEALLSIYRLIWSTAFISIIIASAVIYSVSRRISRPIENIRLAADAIAAGDFSRDVPVEGRDEIARLALSFNYMKNRLRQVEQMRKELIANVSHELRTPLTTIRGFIQGILDGVITPGQQDRYLRLAHQETARLTRLVKDLLELAKLQAGGIKLNPGPVDVAALLKELAEEYRLGAEKRNISINVSPGEKIIVQADQDRLRQIVLNLLSNAVKYSDDGGEIVVGAIAEEAYVRIYVRDSGRGIPDEELERIFDKFHRVDSSRDSASGGTGLGLAIVKELVELHGGRVTARSRLGQGTEMTVEIPG
ncbi:osmosensitive K+ channel histidine kinase KdpD [Desulfocucumis palustris]|uniref:histidine kinase n=1 Tax=Desulfocucumis palustris TaxID=1898651 RepID=A0A2L2XDK4_9FIRM|nr:HAMP domain-containing sensor histidine kinase [Desulfocucumis palustris]GBF33803.1 osmosensitive K+ channel histidine kinase KdpD [Desulfocucumis palustris]